jgi:hypothetical protein
MYAANHACVAGQDDGGTGGGQLSPLPVSRRDEIRDQRGRASNLKLSGVGSQPGLELTGDFRPMRSLTPAPRLHKQDEYP